MVTDEMRRAESAKYRACYSNDRLTYRMGVARYADAQEDYDWALALGCRDVLDVGCGRGEMLGYAAQIGFKTTFGTEIVPELQNDHVLPAYAHELEGHFGRGSIDLVSCFDVIEHLHPGDDRALLDNMKAVARRAVVVTANNRPSVDPYTGNDLHINKRPYDEWDAIIREAWAGWEIERCRGKRYVSETWRAVNPAAQ